jgi:hypothetical protein
MFIPEQSQTKRASSVIFSERRATRLADAGTVLIGLGLAAAIVAPHRSN